MTGKVILLFAFVLFASADPKKGVGCSAGCTDATMRALGANWHYNWGGFPNFPASMEFVPMCYSINDVSKIPGYSNHLLGFNEPDHEGPAKATPREAATTWADMSKKAYTLASPAMAGNAVNSSSTWLKQFFNALGPNPKVDYIAVHHYGKNASRLQEYLTQIYNDDAFGKRPIWLTEFAAQTNAESANPLPQSEVNKFMDEAIPWLRSTPWVHRYAWHSPGSGTSMLWDAAGGLTETGRRYASY